MQGFALKLVLIFHTRLDGKITLELPVEYQWKPAQCDVCMVFGHSQNNCSKNLKTKWTPKKLKNTFQVEDMKMNEKLSIPVDEVLRQQTENAGIGDETLYIENGEVFQGDNSSCSTTTTTVVDNTDIRGKLEKREDTAKTCEPASQTSKVLDLQMRGEDLKENIHTLSKNGGSTEYRRCSKTCRKNH